jgi:hypothetical protein
MNNLRPLLAVLLIPAASLNLTVKAQAPTPIIVQAADAAPIATSSKPTMTVADNQSASQAITLLEKLKAANEEVLAKQKATLERLDELQQNAEQLKIFANRG